MAILKFVFGVLAMLIPFGICLYLLCRVKRNRGSTHGGGIDHYWRTRGR